MTDSDASPHAILAHALATVPGLDPGAAAGMPPRRDPRRLQRLWTRALAPGRPPKAVRPTDEKNKKNRPGTFDFAIWHGIVVSCSGKATRVNTTSPT